MIEMSQSTALDKIAIPRMMVGIVLGCKTTRDLYSQGAVGGNGKSMPGRAIDSLGFVVEMLSVRTNRYSTGFSDAELLKSRS